MRSAGERICRAAHSRPREREGHPSAGALELEAARLLGEGPARLPLPDQCCVGTRRAATGLQLHCHGRRLRASAGDLHDPQRRHTTRAAADGRPPRLLGRPGRPTGSALPSRAISARGSPGDLHHRGRRTDRRLLAPDGQAPSWSPDGETIAYESSHGGVRLVTPAGVDATPARGRSRPPDYRPGRPTGRRSQSGLRMAPTSSPLWRPSASGHEVERRTPASATRARPGTRLMLEL